ncbi:MAG: STAS/SEC14 domain-containing protein [Thermoanaerobaculia bacterium]
MMTEETDGGLELLDFDDPEKGVLAYAIRGKITATAAAPIFERFSKAHEEGTKIRIYADMQDYSGFELGVVTEKAKHMRAIFGTVERMAIVGDAGWLSVWATIFDPVTKPDLRNFKTDQREAALAWLRES